MKQRRTEERLKGRGEEGKKGGVEKQMKKKEKRNKRGKEGGGESEQREMG